MGANGLNGAPGNGVLEAKRVTSERWGTLETKVPQAFRASLGLQQTQDLQAIRGTPGVQAKLAVLELREVRVFREYRVYKGIKASRVYRA